MKKNFFTGLAILLPFALTVWIISFLVDILTNPFLGIAEGILQSYYSFDAPILIFSQEQLLIFWSRVAILIFLAFTAFIVGVFAHSMLIRYLFRTGEYFIRHIPFVNIIYKVVKEGVNAFFSSQKKSFGQAVLVPFPTKDVYCIGFMANENLHPDSAPELLDKVSLFVPGALHCTFGFLLLYERKEIISLNIPVENALKFLISCGTLNTDFKSVN
jgi:uncharacterized membrane protein